MPIYSVKGIKIYYDKEFDGGGSMFGQLYVPVLKRHGIRAENCYEAFSGPAFIGFSLLAHGLCKKITVSDINDKALDNVRKTIEMNKLYGIVNVYHSDVLSSVPSSEKFDLVVGNPPHWPNVESWLKASSDSRPIEILKAVDDNLNIHKRFYKEIKGYLKKNANVILIENSSATSPDDFIQMIIQGGLAYKGVIKPTMEDVIEALKIWARGSQVGTPYYFGSFLPNKIIKIFLSIKKTFFVDFYFVWSYVI